MAFQIKLCSYCDTKEAMTDDSFFTTRQGIFYPEDKLEILEDLIVEKSFRRGYVKEIITGIEIPYVKLMIEEKWRHEVPRSYCYSIFQNSDSSIFAFEVTKPISAYSEVDTEFLRKECSEGDILNYKSRHSNIDLWADELNQYLEEGYQAAKPYQKEKKSVGMSLKKMLNHSFQK